MVRPAITGKAHDLPYPAAIKVFSGSDAVVFHIFLISVFNLSNINKYKNEKK